MNQQTPKHRHRGSAKGLITMSPDFDLFLIIASLWEIAIAITKLW
ncbi:MAG: hypothetical protein QNJ37_22610 [Crocosphaera sp.]|nr:hypothetical protein [Crocosphaera sp.]